MPVDAVLNALSIVEAIRERGGANVTAIAEETGLAKSTVHDHLATLHEAGWLARSGEAYRLSFKFLEFGTATLRREDYYRPAIRKAEELAERTGERAHFVVEEHGHAAFLHTALGENAAATEVETGTLTPLHSTAGGKAILAYRPRRRVEELVDERGLPAVTERTITDREALLEELASVRERGLAENDGEHVPGLWSIAAPITDEDGTVVGSLSVSVPANRRNRQGFEERLSAELLEAVNELELDLAYA